MDMPAKLDNSLISDLKMYCENLQATQVCRGSPQTIDFSNELGKKV